MTTESLCFTLGRPFPSKFPLPMGMIWTSSDTLFLGHTRVLNPNGMSIGQAVFAGLTSLTDRPTDRQADRPTDRPTDRPRYSVGNNRSHLRIRTTAMGLIMMLLFLTRQFHRFCGTEHLVRISLGGVKVTTPPATHDTLQCKTKRR